ncbi:hypothetical protein [Methylobacterium pseudosasicola]|uniref:HTH cro/C1-type domain-containing protein n=1 Tax=Methylobacterium pseudosasicola TaxID=582667 RepID=A0A1I4NF96_9HYPH|nr:hypothetical protein [Methylobacterium pseudosasicola]SFM14139.1 hypothetical protein SAMN05192568_1020104 [Methylobacterium pseudosasicola]
MSGTEKPGTQTLLTLADILGIPVDRFFTGDSGSPGTAGMQECLRLWSCIKTDAGRERALTALRGIVEDEQR